jgi:Cu2+-containing amine oxidase
MKALGFLLFVAVAIPTLATDEVRHPLDPLTAAEISTVVSVLHEAGKVNDSARYPHVLGASGYPVSHELKPGHNAMSILSPEDFPTRRAGFTDYMLWVTPYAPNER